MTEPQRRADWFELFFDLVFVVTVSVLAHGLHGDAALNDLYARVGRDAATEAIGDRVYAAIADSYPDLADQARRQAAERREL
jgi:hypothetical protein